MANSKKNELHGATRKFDSSNAPQRGKKREPKVVFVNGARVSPKRSPA
jgi:hypothetical protein